MCVTNIATPCQYEVHGEPSPHDSGFGALGESNGCGNHDEGQRESRVSVECWVDSENWSQTVGEDRGEPSPHDSGFGNLDESNGCG